METYIEKTVFELCKLCETIRCVVHNLAFKVLCNASKMLSIKPIHITQAQNDRKRAIIKHFYKKNRDRIV